MTSIKALLPRDFLERQPKRWQKSQRKRRVLGVLRKLKVKREQLEEATIRRAAPTPAVPAPAPGGGGSGARAPRGRSSDDDGATARAVAAGSKPSAPSHSTPFGPNATGLWAAELMPYKALVVSIPEGVELCLLRASLAPAGGRHDFGERSALRCRTPRNPLPATLCFLRPEHAETCALSSLFSGARDGRCALAVEGPDPVHLVGSYQRKPPGGTA